MTTWHSRRSTVGAIFFGTCTLFWSAATLHEADVGWCNLPFAEAPCPPWGWLLAGAMTALSFAGMIASARSITVSPDGVCIRGVFSFSAKWAEVDCVTISLYPYAVELYFRLRSVPRAARFRLETLGPIRLTGRLRAHLRSCAPELRVNYSGLLRYNPVPTDST